MTKACFGSLPIFSLQCLKMEIGLCMWWRTGPVLFLQQLSVPLWILRLEWNKGRNTEGRKGHLPFGGSASWWRKEEWQGRLSQDPLVAHLAYGPFLRLSKPQFIIWKMGRIMLPWQGLHNDKGGKWLNFLAGFLVHVPQVLSACYSDWSIGHSGCIGLLRFYIYRLYILHPKSSFLLSSLSPLYPLLSPPSPFPFGNHLVLSVSTTYFALSLHLFHPATLLLSDSYQSVLSLC